MPTYKTPNVYVEEISTLAPSVVPVSTAIPAFIGYTEKAGNKGEYQGQAIRISSLLDYTNLFGGAKATAFTVDVDTSNQIESVTPTLSGDSPEYLMYYALQLFFSNGGGSCYIISIGDYSSPPAKDDFYTGLATLRKEDEPTLILLTDAIHLAEDDYYELCQATLKQCNDLKDRFAIFDILPSDRDTNGIGAKFRQGIGTSYLKYGAAYYPDLQTSLNYAYDESTVSVSSGGGTGGGEYRTDPNGLRVTYSGPETDSPKLAITVTSRASIACEVDDAGTLLTLRLPSDGAPIDGEDSILAAWSGTSTKGLFNLEASGDGSVAVTEALAETPLTYDAGAMLGDDAIKINSTDLYNKTKTALSAQRVVMPPSPAVAGVYAKVDRERGVWKAPANVSLATVTGPTVKVTNEEQENLNVDATAGKSINAIRSFTGKGTLVWGARTLAGNDNEWRYVPVRRLFNLIEESIQKATAFVVFESNNAITWLKVKTIIESYLDSLWRDGALTGSTQDEAYFVNVGLGQSMTEQDILEGRMIIDIGVAAVRPAEFIILKFSHKLQQA